MTTTSEIKAWFDRGVNQGSAYMIVAADLFDYEDYPIYLGEDPVEFWKRFESANDYSNMQKVMECYDLRKPWEDQKSGRTMNTPKKP